MGKLVKLFIVCDSLMFVLDRTFSSADTLRVSKTIVFFVCMFLSSGRRSKIASLQLQRLNCVFVAVGALTHLQDEELAIMR